ASETEKIKLEKFNQNHHGSSNSADDWTTDPRENDRHISRHPLNELQSNDSNNRDENDIFRSKCPTSLSHVNKNPASSSAAFMATSDVHLLNAEKFSTATTGNNRNTEDQIQRILANLGLADRGYLVPYDLRILCQHLGLNGLTSQELAALFNHLDNDGDGKISVQDFLNAYPLQQQQSQNSHDTAENCSNFSQITAVTDTSRSYCNLSLVDKSTSRRSSGCANRNFKSGTVDEIWTFLFSSLDVDNTGQVTLMDLVRHWKCNNMIDCLEMLRNLKIPTQGETKVYLETLRHALSDLISEKCDNDPNLSTIFHILRAEISYSNESLLENREQISFFTKEVQQLNQRNGLLVDELEQNHQNLEIKSQQQLRDLEEKYQNKVASLEQKYKNEREQWYEEIKDRDEMIHRAQQNESSSQYRHRQLERENFKLKAEIDDLLMTLKELEGANDDLRTTLEEAYSLRKKNLMDDSQKSFYINSISAPQTSTPRSVRLFENDGKKLKRKRQGPILTPILLRRSIRRQKLLLDESSEFESDPADYMFDRIKCKRPLKKKQRLALVAHRLQSPHYFCESPTTSSSESLALPSVRDRNDKSSVISLRFNDCCSVINTHLNSLEKHLNDDYQFWIKQLKIDVADLETNFESEKRLIKEEYEKRIDRMTSQFAEEKLKLTDCLESDLRKKFEQEKRDIEIRFLSERNILERRFAEEKMKIMERLQDEFDTELKRVKNSKCCFNASHTAMMANSINTRSNMLEKEKLVQEQTKLQNRVKSLVEELNFVRTRLNAEEREKSNLKVYSEQLKRDFASK
uniref:EF-hand domain-containing protein n=1 Tax=Romanomermis culicivorax TaxID=13658 RepID=A0A915JU48_ROMCU